MKELKSLHFPTRAKWRQWLEKNHQCSPGIWIIFFKKHIGVKTVSYNDAVEEALCFGWIDSILHRIDDARYKQKFSPRRSRSSWSLPNIERAKRMIAEGKMTASGMKQFQDILSGKDKKRIDRRAPRIIKMPLDFRKVLQSDRKASEFFRSLAPSYKRQFLLWVSMARTEKTRQRRIAEAMEYLTNGRKLGMK